MSRQIACWTAGCAVIVGMSILPASGAQQKTQGQQNSHMQGQIVRTDPQTGSVILRTMDGNKAIDRTYKVETGTTFYGADRKPFFDGLTNKSLKQGADVWYQLGAGDKQNTITNFRLHDPSMAPAKMP